MKATLKFKCYSCLHVEEREVEIDPEGDVVDHPVCPNGCTWKERSVNEPNVHPPVHTEEKRHPTLMDVEP